MLPHILLTAEAAALKKHILAIPRTKEPLDIETPPELDSYRMEDLYHATLEGANWVIPELKKLIALYPAFPTLLNYLRTTYQVRNQPRQAKQALKDLARLHPDYPFTRMGLALEALESAKPDAVAAALGPDLDIAKLFPAREIFHISELTSYYVCVAIHLARRGETGLACGVLGAVEIINPGNDSTPIVEREIMISNAKSISERMQAEESRRISVQIPPLPKKVESIGQPEFHHEEIHFVYEAVALKDSDIREILALPRETLITDLARVLDDCRARTPNFMRYGVEESDCPNPVHALHFLAETSATESLDAVLRFFSLHPDALSFWLGHMNYDALLARIVRGQNERVAEWLKSPGISRVGKGYIVDAMAHLGRMESGMREEIVTTLGDVFSFILASPASDNILDTGLLSLITCALIDLRAANLLPLVAKASEKGYIEESMAGNLDDITREIKSPPRTVKNYVPMVRQYQEYRQQESTESRPALSHSGEEEVVPQAAVGRNDPCPCGSGKKYKKCCMR